LPKLVGYVFAVDRCVAKESVPFALVAQWSSPLDAICKYLLLRGVARAGGCRAQLPVQLGDDGLVVGVGAVDVSVVVGDDLLLC